MIAAPLSALSKTLRRFARAAGGNIAIVTTIALPVIGLAAVGGVQIAAVTNIRTKTQEIADSAALMGAEQLSVASVGATNRAQTWAQGQLAALLGSTSTTYTVGVTTPDPSHLQVTIQTATPSYFGPSLPVGGFPTTVSATAESVTQSPLCMLVLAPSFLESKDLTLKTASQISANCTVYSNSNIAVLGNSKITDLATEVVGTVSGPASNVGPSAAQTGAPAVTNPFPIMSYAGPTGTGAVGACVAVSNPVTSGTLQPGSYCNGLTIGPNANVTLAAGEYQIVGSLTVGANAIVTGSDVVFFFGHQSSMNLSSSAKISIGGRRTGPHAGFVIVTTHNLIQALMDMPFVIQSDPFASITGTVYSPIIPLEFQGGATAAQSSDWTVIVASAITLDKANGASTYPTIQMNANYLGSPVPVPGGVGPTNGTTRLVN